MSYVNADEVLPEDLIREIQKYVDGKVLYIPRRSEKATVLNTGFQRDSRR